MKPCKVCNLETDCEHREDEDKILIPVTVVSKDEAKEMFGPKECEHREPDWQEVAHKFSNTSGKPSVEYVSWQHLIKRNPELEKPVITMYEWMYERDKKDAYNAGLRRAADVVRKCGDTPMTASDIAEYIEAEEAGRSYNGD